MKNCQGYGMSKSGSGKTAKDQKKDKQPKLQKKSGAKGAGKGGYDHPMG